FATRGRSFGGKHPVTGPWDPQLIAPAPIVPPTREARRQVPRVELDRRVIVRDGVREISPLRMNVTTDEESLRRRLKPDRLAVIGQCVLVVLVFQIESAPQRK